MDYEPIGDQLIVLPDAEDSVTTKGGIVLPGRVMDRPKSGVVLAVGPKVTQCRKGDHVLFGRFKGEAITQTVDREQVVYFVLHEEDVYACARPKPTEPTPAERERSIAEGKSR